MDEPILADFQNRPRNLSDAASASTRAPEDATSAPFLVAVDEGGHGGSDVGAGADEQEDDEQERLKVEQGRLRSSCELSRDEDQSLPWSAHHCRALARVGSGQSLCRSEREDSIDHRRCLHRQTHDDHSATSTRPSQLHGERQQNKQQKQQHRNRRGPPRQTAGRGAQTGLHSGSDPASLCSWRDPPLFRGLALSPYPFYKSLSAAVKRMETVSKAKPKRTHHHHQHQPDDMHRPPSSNAPYYPTAQPYSGGYPRAPSPLPPSSYGGYPAPPNHPSAPHPAPPSHPAAPHPSHSPYAPASSPPFGYHQSGPPVGGFIDAQGAPLTERRHLPDPPQHQVSPPRVGTTSPSAPYRGHTPSPHPATPGLGVQAPTRDEEPAWLAGLSTVSREAVVRYASRLRDVDGLQNAGKDRSECFKFVSNGLDGEKEHWRRHFCVDADRKPSLGAVTTGMGGLGMHDRPPQGPPPSSTGPPSWSSEEWRPSPYGQYQQGPSYGSSAGGRMDHGVSSPVGRMEQAANEYDARPARPPASGPDNLASYVYGGSGPPPNYESHRQPSYSAPQDPQLYSPPEDSYPSPRPPQHQPFSAPYGRGPSYSSPEREQPRPHEQSRPQEGDYRRASAQYPPPHSPDQHRTQPPPSGYQAPYAAGPPSAYPSSPPPPGHQASAYPSSPPARGRQSPDYPPEPPITSKPTSPPPAQHPYYGGQPNADPSSYRGDPSRPQPQKPVDPQSQTSSSPSEQHHRFPAIATSSAGVGPLFSLPVSALC